MGRNVASTGSGGVTPEERDPAGSRSGTPEERDVAKSGSEGATPEEGNAAGSGVTLLRKKTQPARVREPLLRKEM